MLVQFLNMCQSFGDTYENENTYVRNGVEDMHIGYTRALFALWRIGIRHWKSSFILFVCTGGIGVGETLTE